MVRSSRCVWPCGIFIRVLTGLSPYRQRPLAGMLRAYVFNGSKRTMQQLPYVAPPLIFCTLFPSRTACCAFPPRPFSLNILLNTDNHLSLRRLLLGKDQVRLLQLQAGPL